MAVHRTTQSTSLDINFSPSGILPGMHLICKPKEKPADNLANTELKKMQRKKVQCKLILLLSDNESPFIRTPLNGPASETEKWNHHEEIYLPEKTRQMPAF
ncbi:unnamed protein product [Orchesella dallaii]|uniref:Uncharacterized protein n=1 Tax=Orchesella dallaii TaxID=48710 RepID=A0ABP1S661_9HEXA